MRRKTNAKIVVLLSILVIALCIPAIIVLRDLSQSKLSLHKNTGSEDPMISDENEAYAGQFPYETLEYQGKTYTYNSQLRNYLFLGIDKREFEQTMNGHANAGQCDALFLLSWDSVSGETTLISIPRDTITEITVYSYDGVTSFKQQDHISLSYAYGDGGPGSCVLSVKAASKLLNGIPIWGYMALDLDSLPTLMDTVGTLDVQVPNDSLVFRDESLTEGSMVKVDASNVEFFVRSRDNDVAGSPLTRMERQQAFLDALLDRMQSDYAAGGTNVAKLYLNLDEYMETNISADQLGDVMKSLSDHTPAAWTIPGTAVKAEYDEYHVNEDQLVEKMIETFYKLR